MPRNQPVCLRDYGGLCCQGFKTCRLLYSLLSSLLLCSKSSILGQQSALLRAVTVKRLIIGLPPIRYNNAYIVVILYRRKELPEVVNYCSSIA